MALTIARDDNQFRVESQYFCTSWVSDSAENRKAMLVFLRLMVDGNGKPLFTHQQLAQIVGSDNRQACSHHVESFVACGSDFLSFLTRKRKVNSEVVNAVLEELLLEPLANISELSCRVNNRLKRNDISDQNIKVALESISYFQVRGEITSRLSKGKAHYKEEYLLSEMIATFSSEKVDKAGVAIPSSEAGMQLSDPTAIRSLLNDKASLSSLGKPLQWVCFIMALYYHGLPLSVLGKWFCVHKTTILRWVISLAVALWPYVYSWINRQVKARVVYIDEKWIKIKGKWHYWFVVLDHDTELPVIASLLAKKSKWSIRFIATQLKQLRKIPTIVITDGMLGYDCIQAIGQRVRRILCHFHHQQSITSYLKKNFKEEQIPQRKKAMKKMIQAQDKRTVKRRFEQLKSVAEKLKISEWIAETERKLPKLLPAVGSRKIPTTNNAIERFFRAFNRFYKVRCGFFSPISAKRELIFFMLMYLFIKQPETNKAPVEAIMPKAKMMPFYQLVNDPIIILFNTNSVKDKAKMADFSLKEKLLEQV
jgi:transposase-like protein